jgi:hypothetical protein
MGSDIQECRARNMQEFCTYFHLVNEQNFEMRLVRMHIQSTALMDNGEFNECDSAFLRPEKTSQFWEI